jgi:hypothetical protein
MKEKNVRYARLAQTIRLALSPLQLTPTEQAKVERFIEYELK